MPSAAAAAESPSSNSCVAREHIAAFLGTPDNLFTVINTKTGKRFTFRTAAPKNEEGPAWMFVEVLTGTNNETDYEYIGSVYKTRTNADEPPKPGPFYHSPKSRITADALSVQSFAWLWRHRLVLGEEHPNVIVHHSGKCHCCGRSLTTPESLARGIGPICAAKWAA